MRIKIVCIMFVAFISITANAQVLSYYPFQSIVSVSTNTDRKLWLDGRVETNSFFSNLNMELSPMLNVYHANRVNGYTGLGVNFNPSNMFGDLPVVNGYALNMGVRARPFEKYAGLQIIFELGPYLNYELTNGTIRTRLGLGYNFKRAKSD